MESSASSAARSRRATRTTRTAARKPRAKAARREETMTLILDCAEKLFALLGRDGVTIRALGNEAKVDPALVHYYFGDMDGVFREAFHRKASILNAIRNKAMDDYLAAHGRNPTVEGAFEVFLRPVVDTFANDPKYWNYFAILVSYVNSSAFQGRELMREAFDVTVGRFIDLLKQLAPEVPEREIYWFYHQMSGSISVSLAQTGRIDALSRGLCKSSDIRSAFESLKLVYMGGYESLRARHLKPLPATKASRRKQMEK